MHGAKSGSELEGDRGVKHQSAVHSDAESLEGTPVFVGTRVPFQTLIDYLEEDQTLAEFLADFPTVSRDQAISSLEEAKEAVLEHACILGPSNDPIVPSHDCSDWAEIFRCLEAFPPPEVTYAEGCVTRTGWVFRGLADSNHSLEPAIERQTHHKDLSWLAFERLVSLEFKSHARMHLGASLVPDSRDEFTWLAQMQHYGIPTRLLDFTYSPFVALYFAIRDQQKDKKRSGVSLWAIDEIAVNDRFKQVTFEAAAKERERAGKRKYNADSGHPDDTLSVGDSVAIEIQGLQTLISESLLATGTYREELEQNGCVAIASPPAFNHRLASQQGVFLVNCAEKLDFGKSLNKMMARSKTEWCKRFDIAIDACIDIEQRLFQMNVHEQSLFPDIEGLAGFIRQRVRLHWK
jgi:uncharacterized protein (DUF433 family)